MFAETIAAGELLGPVVVREQDVLEGAGDDLLEHGALLLIVEELRRLEEIAAARTGVAVVVNLDA